MNPFLRLPVLLAIIGLNACSMVVSERVVGDRPADATGFSGTWKVLAEDEEILVLAVRDGPGGILSLQDGGDETRFELLEKHGWIFANRVVAEEGAAGFAWYRVEMAPDGASFRLWAPDVAAFENLIAAGTLKGRIIDRGQPAPPPQPGAGQNPPGANARGSGTIVVISEKNDGWIQHMMEGRFGKVFDDESPATYVRIPEQVMPPGAE